MGMLTYTSQRLTSHCSGETFTEHISYSSKALGSNRKKWLSIVWSLYMHAWPWWGLLTHCTLTVHSRWVTLVTTKGIMYVLALLLVTAIITKCAISKIDFMTPAKQKQLLTSNLYLPLMTHLYNFVLRKSIKWNPSTQVTQLHNSSSPWWSSCHSRSWLITAFATQNGDVATVTTVIN